MQWINFQQTLAQRLNHEQLDEEQIRVKNFGIAGHALIRGVAGSGKSLVLRSRVEQVIEQKLDSVLVLSYNRFMRGWIQTKLCEKRISVECDTFHAWAWRHLGYSYEHDKDLALRQKAIDIAEHVNLKYEAILVDEAQDFYDEWFQILLNVLDQTTNSLFFVYDNAQSVYGQAHRRKPGWNWRELGINVVGRSQIFDLNYRNAPEILEVAWKFMQPALEQAGMKVSKKESSPSIDAILEPKKKLSRSSGIQPSLVQIQYAEMASEIAKQVKLALDSHANSSIGILLHPTDPNAKALKAAISKELRQLGIPNHAPVRSGERLGNIVDRPLVIVDSWNALKGVEFDAVVIAGIDAELKQTRNNETNVDQNFEEKAGLYTAMTRARDHLVILYETKTATVEQIEQIIYSPNQLSGVV
jgi:superfamily I DNA/RNA helicase